MATAFKELNTLILIADTAGSHLTCGSGETIHVQGIMLHNTHSSALTVILYKVPNSSGSLGTAAAGNQFYEQELAADKTVMINDIPLYLWEENDSIQAVCGTASKVNIFIEGAVQT